MHEYNVTGISVMSIHYMVDISEKVEEVMHTGKRGKCF